MRLDTSPSTECTEMEKVTAKSKMDFDNDDSQAIRNE